MKFVFSSLFQVFAEVARQVMRVDISLLKRGEPEEDHRLLIKSVAASAAAPKPVVPGSSEAAAQADHEDLSNSVIADLLNFLVLESCPVTPLSVEGGAEAMETTSPEDVMKPFLKFIVFNRFNTGFFVRTTFLSKRENVHLFSNSLPRFTKCHKTSRIFPRTEQTFASARSFGVSS